MTKVEIFQGGPPPLGPGGVGSALAIPEGECNYEKVSQMMHEAGMADILREMPENKKG